MSLQEVELGQFLLGAAPLTLFCTTCVAMMKNYQTALIQGSVFFFNQSLMIY